MKFNFIFEKPGNWDEFEDIVASLVSLEFGNPNFQRYGRRGQCQFGVDIAGVTDTGLIGIQCKHVAKLDETEIKRIVNESRKFTPPLNKFIIATTVNRDSNITENVIRIQLNETDNYLQSVWYWDEIVNKIKRHPQLLFEIFGSDYQELYRIVKSDIYKNRKLLSLNWPFTRDQFNSFLVDELSGLPKGTTPYKISIGISNRNEAKRAIPTDINLVISDIEDSIESVEQRFFRISERFIALRDMLDSDNIDKTVVFDVNLYLAHAFLLGRIFGKEKGWRPEFIQNDTVWQTKQFNDINHGLRIRKPVIINRNSSEIAVIISRRDIKKKVLDSIKQWSEKPSVLYDFTFEQKIIFSDVPMAIGEEITGVLNGFIDETMITKVHLFLATPKSLAAIIGHNLNLHVPIALYYLGDDRKTYKLAGIVNSSQ